MLKVLFALQIVGKCANSRIGIHTFNHVCSVNFISLHFVFSRRTGLAQWLKANPLSQRSWVRRSLSAKAGVRLASVIPSPDPTHVGATSTGSVLFFSFA